MVPNYIQDLQEMKMFYLNEKLVKDMMRQHEIIHNQKPSFKDGTAKNECCIKYT